MNAAPASLPLSQKEKAVVALALSWSAGCVDALGYLALSGTFAAHMTGNTVSSVMHGVQGRWTEMVRRAMPIPLFFLGLLVGEVVLELAKRRGRRHIAARVLGIEAVCLGGFLGMGIWVLGTGPGEKIGNPKTWEFVVMVGLIAAAMGLQSASMRKVGAVTIFTTFITGTLTKLANDLSAYLFWVWDQIRAREKRGRWKRVMRLSWREESFQAVVVLLGLYVAYVMGALAGAVGFYRWGVLVAAAPLGVVMMGVAVDWVRPIAPMP
jgi:uncharacterized membrane protein YoaK (UPF0700 family)